MLAELARRGHATVEEPGRRIVRQELDRGGVALPWLDMAAFARRALAMAADEHAAAGTGWTFYDRGLVDAASTLEHATGEPALATLDRAGLRYHRIVFLAPPWPALFETDSERRHDFDAAVEEYDRLVRDYARLGYDPCLLPRSGIEARADFVLATIGAYPDGWER